MAGEERLVFSICQRHRGDVTIQEISEHEQFTVSLLLMLILIHVSLFCSKSRHRRPKEPPQGHFQRNFPEGRRNARHARPSKGFREECSAAAREPLQRYRESPRSHTKGQLPLLQPLHNRRDYGPTSVCVCVGGGLRPSCSSDLSVFELCAAAR